MNKISNKIGINTKDELNPFCLEQWENVVLKSSVQSFVLNKFHTVTENEDNTTYEYVFYNPIINGVVQKEILFSADDVRKYFI